VTKAAKKVLWLTSLIKELDIQQGGVQLHCDSQNVIYLAKNQARGCEVSQDQGIGFFSELLLEKVHF
jgi:hypothetical protein